MTAGKRWAVGRMQVNGRGQVKFGPDDASLPERFTGTVTYLDPLLRVTVAAVFDGDHVAVTSLTVEGIEGDTVTPRGLTLLQLGSVVRAMTMRMLDPGTAVHVRRRPGRAPTPEELRLLASVYWLEHVTWGDPRRAVMQLWDLPRSTASGWIRKAREIYDMPAHREHDR